MVATQSRTPVALTSLAGNQFMKAYRITTPFRAGGFAYAIQPHREVRPESGLSIYEIYDMKAYRITTPFRAESGRVGGGGVAFAVQPHREVRPGSGLVGIVEHIEVNKR